MNTIAKSLKKHWDQASAHVGPNIKKVAYFVAAAWGACFFMAFIALRISGGSWEYLANAEFWAGVGIYGLWLGGATFFLLGVVRFGFTTLLALGFWLSSASFASTAQMGHQFSFAYANGANCEQHWEPITPTTRFEFSKTASRDSYTLSIPAKPGETCYEATVDGNNFFIVNTTVAAKTLEKKIVAKRMQRISDLTRYTVAHAPLTSEGMVALLHNIAHIYEGDFKQNNKSDQTIKLVKIRQLELMTYAAHVKELTGISRSRAVAFINNSFYCQLNAYDSYKKIGNYTGEHKYFKKTETISDWVNNKKA